MSDQLKIYMPRARNWTKSLRIEDNGFTNSVILSVYLGTASFARN